MHTCNTICKFAAPATPRSSVHFYDPQLNVVETTNDKAHFMSIQSYAGNAEGLVRVDSNSLVVCTDPCAQMLPCIDVEAQAQAPNLPCFSNLQAQAQMRLISIDVDEEEMHPCMYADTQTQPAACIDVYAHIAQAASCRDQQRVHDQHMQRDAQYSNAQEDGYLRMQSCLPPMSSTLIECIERARARAVRCKGMWKMMQLMSIVSQIMGVLLVLGLCSKEEVLMRRSLHYTMCSPLPAWALGYALGCVASLPLFCIKNSQTTGSDDLLDIDEHGTHENRGEGMEKRLRRYVDFFFGIWIVLGVVWVFGRPSCAQAGPKVYSLCVTLLILNGLRYMMPLVLCCALCCCLQPATSRISNDFDRHGGGKKGASQESIDATLPIFKFQDRRPITNNLHDHETFPIASTTSAEKSTPMDAMEYCCICLKRYKKDTKLRELPCSHCFHVHCVDKWLKINASCPLCKYSLKANKLHRFPFLWDRS